MTDISYLDSHSDITLLGDKIEEYNPKNFQFFVKPSEYDISVMKLEAFDKYAKIIQWGRSNPIKFCERFFGVEFLDYQKYIFMMSWITPFVVWCMSRNGGKTTLGSPFLMAKTLLIPKFEGYILGSNGSQSIGMMKKIEAIAKREIASFTGLTDVFLNELVKSQAQTDGFKHDPASYSYKVYSGSGLATVNSNYDGSRGKRSRLNFYDEASYIQEAMFAATLPFITQNSDFSLGGNIDVTLLPPNFPNQVVYASSAGSTEDVFFKRYKEFSLHSFAGDKRFFCADIDCDVILTATYEGKIYPTPLLTQEKIDSEMSMNPIKAAREYKNKFDTEGGEGQIVRKAQIIRNSEVRPPLLLNNTNKGLYSLAYDPARKKDNSVITIGEFYEDDKKGWCMNLVNCVNLVDIQTKKRHPITSPEQLKRIKQLILDYNGIQTADYECIRHLLIDAGTGGGGDLYADNLFMDWYEDGHEGDITYLHRGLIDREYSEEYVKKFPNAINKVKLLEPKKYKTDIFLALIEMIEQDLISFPAEYDNHGYLTMLLTDISSNNEDSKASEKIYRLDSHEEESLKQIDALKEEVTHMYRYKASNKSDRFDLAPGMDSILNDDRAYTMAMLAWDLLQLRREHIVNKRKPKQDPRQMFRISKQPKKWGVF